jgi:hypothetical protein
VSTSANPSRHVSLCPSTFGRLLAQMGRHSRRTAS